MPLTPEQLDTAVNAAYGHYRADAVKRGRNPAYPHVPIYRYNGPGRAQTKQLQGRAYAERADAINCAQRYIDLLKDQMRDRLQHPGSRALREQWGLPRELSQ
jgi:hypothetical protein